jgi:hypothetical protein
MENNLQNIITASQLIKVTPVLNVRAYVKIIQRSSLHLEGNISVENKNSIYQ